MPTDPGQRDDARPFTVASYRLQMTPGFGFDDAAAIFPYLAALGVDTVYTSPILQAAAGSMHGYDVVDHARVSEDLGGLTAWRRFTAGLRSHGLSQLADIVPNHMSIGDRRNAWWWDVLENGPASRFASFFDVDWDPPERRNRDVVLMPILGDHRAACLEKRELRVVREGARFVVAYYEHRLPVAPRSLDELLLRASEQTSPSPVRSMLAFLADAFGGLPKATVKDADSRARRHRDKEVLTSLLDRLLAEAPDAVCAVDDALAALNDDPAAMDDFLDRQNHRVAFWKTAGQELDYRRFFDVNTLAALRSEDPVVFEAVHATVRAWAQDGVLSGVRVDHVDGLFDPKGYLERLRALVPQARILVEKILEPDEELRADWPVQGTTGYDFLNDAMAVVVDPVGCAPLTALYEEVTGDRRPFAEIAAQKRELVLREVLGSDVNRLVDLLAAIAGRRRAWRDYTRQDLLRALRAVLAAFPVYRTYVVPGRVTDEDERRVEEAIVTARVRHPDVDARLYDLLRDLLLLRLEGREEADLAARFQQLTGPAIAKGLEDTAFYAYARLSALNEVGGDPARFGGTLKRFHDRNARAAERWPERMLATSTHDTKRGEDVRARLVLLAEIPERWSKTVRSWFAMNAPKRSGEMPDPDLELLMYQTLVGAFPLSRERAQQYIEKAAREAKSKTSWTKPNAAFDAALAEFVAGCFADATFTQDVERFARQLIVPGRTVSLAWTLWKTTCPGAPDVYQGTETWSLDLVDPDNRRPVDYAARAELLAVVKQRAPEELVAKADDGGPKLRLLHEALALRRRRPEAFSPGASYRALDVVGARPDEVVAYTRNDDVVAVAPRFALRAEAGVPDTSVRLPRGTFRDVVTGEQFEGEPQVSRLLARFPVALLEREGGPTDRSRDVFAGGAR